MANTLQIKRRTSAGVPSGLAAGELAVNLSDSKLYVGNAAANGVIHLNPSASTSYLPLAGGTLTGDLELGDSDKLTLGAGADLSIYHDGSNSYIKDAGTGSLLIEVAGTGDSGFYKVGGEKLATFEPDGPVKLYHNNSLKLETLTTGIKVTGIVNADVLNNAANSANIIYRSGSSTIVGNNASALVVLDNGNTGLGTTSAASLLHLYSSAPVLTIQDGGTHGTNATPYIELKDGSSTMQLIGATSTAGHLDIKQKKAASVRLWTNDAERLTIASTGETKISRTGDEPCLELATNNAGCKLLFARSGDPTAYIRMYEDGSTGSGSLRFATGTSATPVERLKIGTDGVTTLTTAGNTTAGATGYYGSLIINNTGSNTWSRFRFDRSNVEKWGIGVDGSDVFRISNLFTGGTAASPNDSCFVIDNNGQIGINTDPDGGLKIKSRADGENVLNLVDSAGDAMFNIRQSANDCLIRAYKDGGSQQVQIHTDGDSYFNGGNVGIGTSSSFSDSQLAVVGADNVGIALQSTHSGKTSRIRFFDNSGNQDATVGFSNTTSSLFMGAGTGNHFSIDSNGAANFTQSSTYGIKLTYSNGNTSGIVDSIGGNLEFRVQNTQKLILNSTGAWFSGGVVGPASDVGSDLGAYNLRWYNIFGARLRAGDGNAANPGITFINDLDTGLYRPANDTMHLVTGGASRITLSSSEVGINTTNPSRLLDIASTSNAAFPLKIRGNIDNNGGYTGIVFGYESDTTNYEKAAIMVEGTSGNVQPNMHFLLHSGANNTNATKAWSVLTLKNSGDIDIPLGNLTVTRSSGNYMEIGHDADTHYISTVGSNRDLHISASGTVDAANLKINSDGKVLVNGADDNGGTADFSVATGGDPQISLRSSQVQIGGTDQNWNAKLYYTSGSTNLYTWANNIYINAGYQSSSATDSYDVSIAAATSGTVSQFMLFDGSDASIKAKKIFKVDSNHIKLDHGYSLQWADSHERIESTDSTLKFFTNNSQQMTLSGSNLTTAGTLTATGATLNGDGSNGELYVSRSSGAVILTQAQAAAGKFGTTSNHDLQLMTNNTVYARLTNDGKFGVGIDPAVNCHLHSTSDEVWQYITTDAANKDVGIYMGLDYDGTANYSGIVFDQSDDALKIFNNNSIANHFVINDTGHVSLNSTDLSGYGHFGVLQPGGGNTDGIAVVNGTNSFRLWVDDAGYRRINAGSASVVEFNSSIFNVYKPLTVSGSGHDNATLNITNSANSNARLMLNSGHGNWSVCNSDTVGDALEFRDESAGATRALISSSGDFGINCTPSYKLEVNGDTKITGNFRVEDYIWVKGGLKDDGGDYGTDGQVLSTNGNGEVHWVDGGSGSGSGTVSSSDVGSGTTDGNIAVYTASTTVKQAPRLFYNGSDHSLTINKTSTSGVNENLHVVGDAQITTRLGVGTGPNSSYSAYFNGATYAYGDVGGTSKSFKINHPTKEGMKLRHSSLEGPEIGVYQRGEVQGDTIELPDYWAGLVRDGTVTVQLTPKGSFQQLYVISASNVEVKIGEANGADIDCYYTIYGERADVERYDVEYEGDI